MMIVDALVDFEQYVFCRVSVDTLEEWDGKSSPLEFVLDQIGRAHV